jgi:hypothetical protein
MSTVTAKDNPVDGCAGGFGADGSDRQPGSLCTGWIVDGYEEPGQPLPQAPVGHREPRASDVPSEKYQSDPNDPLSKENAALDRKIKSICRGC